ncbi:MAG: cyanophycin synthetase, partial [Chloroflexota bacterium]|nr:cyanophycin synthetase [Chloroflexota bacterium]
MPSTSKRSRPARAAAQPVKTAKPVKTSARTAKGTASPKAARPANAAAQRRGPQPALRILETRVLRGPNIWWRSPAITLLVDLGELEDWPSNKIPGFNEALIALIPSLEDHACSLGRRGGFVSRLKDGTWLGHVTEHVAIELQSMAGTEAHLGKTRAAGGRGRYSVVYEYRDEDVGREAGRLAVALVNHLVAPYEAPLDFADELEGLIRLAERRAFGPSTQALLDEALSRDIPYIRLDRRSLVQLGQGVHQQRIRATMTSRTPAIAVDLASDKSLTNALLSSAGLPVPRSQVVRTVEGAVEAAHQIGFPCVLKPLDGNHGRGVGLNLRSDADVRKAFTPAYDESSGGDVVVESFVTGNDYRVLIVGGKMAACAERVPASVVGDGKLTVRQLVDRENSDPRRGIGHEKVLTRIKVTPGAEELVAAQGYSMDAVPPKGTRVNLASTGNMSTGGTSIDRTHDAHPDNVEIAETAARVIGLDVAGIDFIVPDIAVPVREQGGAIVEVNAAPGFRMHTHPTEGEPQYVAKPVIDLLFAPGSNARIPIIGVTGTNGKTTTVRMIGHILKLMGRRVGMTTTDGIVVDGRLIRKGDMSGPKSAQMILQNPSVDTAVFEVARGGILREGLGYDRNDVAVVTNVTGDHLGLRGVETMSQLAHVKAVLVDAVPRSGSAVLNADDELVSRMARQSRGRVVLFSMARDHSEPGFDRVDGHCGRGGAAMVLQQTDEGELVVLRHADRTMPLLYTHLIPATFGGRARMNVANALAAAAAAWASGAHLHDIRQGLRTFTTSFFQAPGRLNEIEVDGYKVFLDYCHNVDGMRRLTEFVEAMAHGKGATPGGRAIGMIGIPGDRRNEDHREYGRLAGHAFDAIVVREDKNLRGRPIGESAALVLEGIQQAQKEKGRVKDATIVTNEQEATAATMRMAVPSDLVVLCSDDISAVYRRVMAESKSGVG